LERHPGAQAESPLIAIGVGLAGVLAAAHRELAAPARHDAATVGSSVTVGVYEALILSMLVAAGRASVAHIEGLTLHRLNAIHALVGALDEARGLPLPEHRSRVPTVLHRRRGGVHWRRGCVHRRRGCVHRRW